MKKGEKFACVPWKFLKGRSMDPNRVMSLKPHGSFWACFLEVELTPDGRTMEAGRMYRLTNVPPEIGADYVCLKRLYGTKAHLVGVAKTQEPLILLAGVVDPDKAVILDMALGGAIPITVIDDHLVVSARDVDSAGAKFYVTDRDSVTITSEVTT